MIEIRTPRNADTFMKPEEVGAYRVEGRGYELALEWSTRMNCSIRAEDISRRRRDARNVWRPKQSMA